MKLCLTQILAEHKYNRSYRAYFKERGKFQRVLCSPRKDFDHNPAQHMQKTLSAAPMQHCFGENDKAFTDGSDDIKCIEDGPLGFGTISIRHFKVLQLNNESENLKSGLSILTTTFLISLDYTIVETMSESIFFPITMN